MLNEFGATLPVQSWLDSEEQIDDEDILNRIIEQLEVSYGQKADQLGNELLIRLEKEIALMILDRHWKEHLAAMDYLRQSVSLRGYAQKNPVQEFKRESFEMFTDMLDSINYETVQALTRVQIKSEDEVDALAQNNQEEQNLKMEHASAQNPLNIEPEQSEEMQQPFVRKEKKVGRNEPCWCGSGKKFKQCHGKL